MDPLIDLGASQVRLSAVRHDQQSRSDYLGPLYRSGAPAWCLCGPTPVEMGVARRVDRGHIYYLYHLHRGDPSLHQAQCPHRVESEQDNQAATPSEADCPAPPVATGDPSTVVVHVPALEPRVVRPPAFDGLTGVPALLDCLLLGSGLNAWHPGFAGHRSYYHARFRLIEASKRIRPFGSSTLADVLYFPPPWDPAKKDDIEFQWQWFVDQLKPRPDGAVPRGVIMGKVREFETRPGWSAPRIRLADSRIYLWLDGCPGLFGAHPPPEHNWVAMLVVEASANASKLRVVDGSASLISPQWIPLASPAHVAHAAELVKQGTPFVAPLRCDPATSPSYPDLLVTGRGGVPTRIAPRPEPQPA